LKNLPELAVDLIAKILTPTPEKRLTPKEALKHPWIAQFLKK
jgi:serine/threonine protein kinase